MKRRGLRWTSSLNILGNSRLKQWSFTSLESQPLTDLTKPGLVQTGLFYLHVTFLLKELKPGIDIEDGPLARKVKQPCVPGFESETFVR